MTQTTTNIRRSRLESTVSDEGQDNQEETVARAPQRAPRVRPDTSKKTEELSQDLRAELNNGTAAGVTRVRQWRDAGVADEKILRAVGLQDWDSFVAALNRDDAAWVETAVRGLTSSSHKDACKFGMFAVKARYNLANISGQWGGKALSSLWDALARVPANHVSRYDNTALQQLVGVKKALPGASEYGGGRIEMVYQNTDRFLTTMKVGDIQGDSNAATYARAAKRGLLGLAGKRQTQVHRQNLFSHTVLHEVGHAVDDQLNVMDGHMGDPKFGAWERAGTDWRGLASAAVSAYNAGGGGTVDGTYAQHVTRRVGEGMSLADAKRDVDRGPFANSQNLQASIGQLKANPVVQLATRGQKGKVPWNNPPTAINGRVFHQAYGNEFYSYDAGLRPQLEISQYQWRAPGEYFAEIYAAYYTGSLPQGHPVYEWFEAEIHNRANMDPQRLRNPTEWEQAQQQQLLEQQQQQQQGGG